MINFSHIDPVIFSLGPFSLRWYSLAYVFGVLIGMFYIEKINNKYHVIKAMKPYDDMMVYVITGILCGGRLGYVLFYNFSFYFSHPVKIFYLWEGGMSFHGGFLGVVIAMIFYCRKYKFNFLQVMDMFACAAPIGLFFGRIANFINGELYGRVTDVSWAVSFPSSPFGLPRHPSQLYEAFLEGFILFLIMFFLVWFTDINKRKGVLSGVFLCGYSLSRIFVEFYREPDIQIGFVFDFLTLGQILSLPMLLLGVSLIAFFSGKKIVE